MFSNLTYHCPSQNPTGSGHFLCYYLSFLHPFHAHSLTAGQHEFATGLHNVHLSFFPLLQRNANNTPLHSDVESGSGLWGAQGRYLCICVHCQQHERAYILFTKSANESKLISSSSLFKNSSNIYLLIFIQNSHWLTIEHTSNKSISSKTRIIFGGIFF